MNEDVPVYRCPECQLGCSTPQSLGRHRSQAHQVAPKRRPAKPKLAEAPPPSPEMDIEAQFAEMEALLGRLKAALAASNGQLARYRTLRTALLDAEPGPGVTG